MKRIPKMLFGILIVMTLVVPTLTAGAQDNDACNPETIVSGFTAAVAAGAVDSWAASVESSNCPNTIKEGAAGLAESYATIMSTSPDEPEIAESEEVAEDSATDVQEATAQEIAYGGEYPVVEYTNVLGLSATIEVAGAQYYDSRRCIPLGAAVEVAPHIFIVSELEDIRQIRQEGDLYYVVYSDGHEIQGKPRFYLNEHSGPQHDMDGITEYRLVSLPEPEEVSDTSDDEAPQVWSLDIPELELSYTGTSPYWRYREVRCNVTVIGIGASPYGTTSSVTIKVDDQNITVSLSDLSAVTVGDDQVTVTVPSGQQTTGDFVLEGGSQWFLRLQIDDLRQVWVDSMYTFSLTKVE